MEWGKKQDHNEVIVVTLQIKSFNIFKSWLKVNDHFNRVWVFVDFKNFTKNVEFVSFLGLFTQTQIFTSPYLDYLTNFHWSQDKIDNKTLQKVVVILLVIIILLPLLLRKLVYLLQL